MSVPCVIDDGPLFVIVMSADGVMVVVALAVLLFVFGSNSLALTVAVFDTLAVLPAVIVSVNCAESPLPSEFQEQVTVPLMFGGGVLQPVATAPLFCVREVKVVFGGNGSVHVAFVAVSGPLFVTVMV